MRNLIPPDGKKITHCIMETINIFYGWCSSTVVTVDHLCWCRFLQEQHEGSCSLLSKKCTANGGDYAPK